MKRLNQLLFLFFILILFSGYLFIGGCGKTPIAQSITETAQAVAEQDKLALKTIAEGFSAMLENSESFNGSTTSQTQPDQNGWHNFVVRDLNGVVSENFRYLDADKTTILLEFSESDIFTKAEYYRESKQLSTTGNYEISFDILNHCKNNPNSTDTELTGYITMLDTDNKVYVGSTSETATASYSGSTRYLIQSIPVSFTPKNSSDIYTGKFVASTEIPYSLYYTVELNTDILRNGTKIGSINLKQDSYTNKIILTIYDVDGNLITL